MTENSTSGSTLTSRPGTPHEKENVPPSSSSPPPDTEAAHPDEEPQHATTTAATHNPERTILGFRWFLVCVAIFSANFLYGLDATIAADIQAPVSQDFGEVQKLGWLGFGFGLGSTASILPLGKAYAMFDTKWMFLGSLTMFSIGSALCGAAPTMDVLIVGRVLAGSGGSGMYLGTLNLVTLLTSPREQAFYTSFEGLVYGGGCLIGPVVGGLFSDSPATWRWAFYINLVIFGAFAPIYLFVLPPIPQQSHTPAFAKLKRLDWLGIVLSMGMYTSLVLAFAFGGAIWAWSDPRFIALVIVFGVLLLAFATSQYFCLFTTKMDRLYPCEFLASFQLIVQNFAISAGGAALFVGTYYIPLYFQFVRGDTGTQAAVRLLPFVAFYVTAIMVCGYALPRAGHHWLWFFVSGLLLVAGAVGMYTIGKDTPAAHTYGFSVLLGLGLAASMAPYSIVPYMVKPERISEAIQFLNNAQGQSQMLGLLIASAIFQSEALSGVRDILQPEGYSDGQIRDAVAGSHSDVLREMNADLRRRCLEAIVETIQHEWILVITAGVLITLCGAVMPKKRHS